MDERIRELERQAAQGDPSAQVRLLAERLRLGGLSLRSVERAAWLGDPHAREVLGDAAPAAELELNALFFGLWSAEAGGRALAALSRAALPMWEEVFPVADPPRRSLEALEAFLAAPGPERGEALEHARVALDWTRERVVLMRMVVNDATTRRLPTLSELETKAQATGRMEAWLGALAALGLSGPQALELFQEALAGPQGEASLHTLVATAFDRPQRAVDLLLDAAHLVTHDEPEDLHAWLNLARMSCRPVARALGTRESRAAIRAALVSWLLSA